MARTRTLSLILDPASLDTALEVLLRDNSSAELSALLERPLLSVDPWALWLLVALHRHEKRQAWVARIVREHLDGDPERLATRGAFGHPKRPQSGDVPGLAGWQYFFHGRGCCLTHQEEGTSIDVDFVDPDQHTIDRYFYTGFLLSSKRPGWLERQIRRDEPYQNGWQAEIPELVELGWTIADRGLLLTPTGRALAVALDPAVASLERLGVDRTLSGYTIATPTPLPSSPGGSTAEGSSVAALDGGEPFPGNSDEQVRCGVALALALNDAVLASRLAELLSPDSFPEELSARVRESAQLQVHERILRLKDRALSSPDTSEAGFALAALAIQDRAQAWPVVQQLLCSCPSDGLLSRVLEIASHWQDPRLLPELGPLLGRLHGNQPPVPWQRSAVVGLVMDLLQPEALDAALRKLLIEAVSTDAGACDGEAGLQLYLLDHGAGLDKLEQALVSKIPLARQESAAALVLIGTLEARRRLLNALQVPDPERTLEARTALEIIGEPAMRQAALRYEAAHPVPAIESHSVEIDGEVFETWSMEDLCRQGTPSWVLSTIESWRQKYGERLQRWSVSI